MMPAMTRAWLVRDVAEDDAAAICHVANPIIAAGR
jgi:hypothetical protein